MRRLIQLIGSLPRAGQWLLLALFFLAGYFLIVEPALDLTQKWRFEGDGLQAALAEVARDGGADSTQSTLLRGAALFGPLRFPADSQQTADQDINRRIVEVFREHAVSISGRETRTVGSIARDSFADVISPEQEARRLIVDVEFTTTPETAVAIISDLEGSQEIHGLGRVHMERTDDAQKRVRVNISPETWFIAERGS